ncbi:MAG: hypothetical protein QXH03_01685 [Candidatus Bathyarchaeia archaeon]
MDWDAYKICIEWCKEEGIRNIADLKGRIVSRWEYEKLWYERCEKMQRALETRRKRKPTFRFG